MLYTIDYVPVTPPSSLAYGVFDISSSDTGRTVSGTLVRRRIAQKIKLECKWNYLTSQQLAQLLNLIDKNEMIIEFLDPRTNTKRTGKFYAGDRSMDITRTIAGLSYTDISINFIEI